MAWQEKYYYRNDPKYSEEEIKQIDKILKKEDRVTAVFVPIVAILFMFMIPCLIFDIIFHIKALELALFILMALFFVALFLWFIFYYKVSQERAKIMTEMIKERCHIKIIEATKVGYLFFYSALSASTISICLFFLATIYDTNKLVTSTNMKLYINILGSNLNLIS